MAIATSTLLLGCNFFGQSGPTPTPTPRFRTTPTPTPVPSPTPTHTATPTLTPTPGPFKSRAEVESLVWSRIRVCADQLANLSQTQLTVDFTTTYSPGEAAWFVEVFSRVAALSFGSWKVVDSSGVVSPRDDVARSIVTPGILCSLPEALLSTGNTPPLFTTPTPSPVPTPTPTRTPIRTPTPTPAISRSMSEVEGLVWSRIRGCADQLATSTQTQFTVDFTTTYSVTEGVWFVVAFSEVANLGFGKWQVVDSTGVVSSRDDVARSIDTPGILCLPPGAYLSSNTPPLFATPTPTPTPTATPTPAPVVGTADQAATIVWASVYGCYGHFPEASSFTATPDGPTRWIVEGRSADTVYGVWSVDAMTGNITPSDQVAEQVTEKCIPTPVVLTAEQAALRVWLATYKCFVPSPLFSAFSGYQDNPQRWIVEGRFEVDPETTIMYGLWLVKTDTGNIEPWDALASQTAAKICFSHP